MVLLRSSAPFSILSYLQLKRKACRSLNTLTSASASGSNICCRTEKEGDSRRRHVQWSRPVLHRKDLSVHCSIKLLFLVSQEKKSDLPGHPTRTFEINPILSQFSNVLLKWLYFPCISQSSYHSPPTFYYTVKFVVIKFHF